MNRMKSFFSLKGLRPETIIKITSAALVLSLFLGAGCEKIKMMKVKKMLGNQETAVSVMTVKPKDTPIVFEYIGETESSHMVEIRARVQGFLDQQLYEEGRMVKANQPMFIIDQKPFKANLQAAKGQLAQQEARHSTALANLNRIRPLAAKNAVSQKDLDDAVGQEQETAAAVIAAKAQVTEAELNLSYTVISSPIDGLSSNAKKQTGSYISAGPDSLLTYVAQIDPMWVNFSISENEYLSLVKQTQTKEMIIPEYGDFDVEIVLADGSVYPQKGKLMFAAPSFSLETRTFLVRAQVNNSKGMLKPGEFVRVRMKGAIRPNAITVARSSVLQGAKGNFVWIIKNDGKASVRQIVLGQWVGNDVIVNSGLFAGDKVVVDGFQKLSEGQKVDKITEIAASTDNKPQSVSVAKTK